MSDKPVKVTRDGVTMQVASQKVADELATAQWKPVPAKTTASTRKK